MSCGVGRRCGSDLTLLWLGRRPMAIALIQPLAWELPYTKGEASLPRPPKKPSQIPRSVGNGDTNYTNEIYTRICQYLGQMGQSWD